MEKNSNLPAHIGIIMDGNGRWAKKKMQPRNNGHQAGAKTLEKISRYANDIGIKYMSVYAFSTENWNRPEKEINGLMNLLRKYLKRHIKESEKANIKVIVTGDRRGLDLDIIELINKLEQITSNKDGMVLNIALNYGGRDEIIRAVQQIVIDSKKNNIDPSNIDEEFFEQYLDTSMIPSPDLIIRTSGEQRLSNFLTWQSAYSEFYFTKCLWPDFTISEFDKALEDYSSRQRRFGSI